MTTLPAHAARVNAVDVQDRVAATASDDGTVVVWCPFEAELQRSGRAHAQAVRAVAVPAADVVVTGATDGRVVLWSLPRAALGAGPATAEPHPDGVAAVAIAPTALVSGPYMAPKWCWHVHALTSVYRPRV
jgi:WD40 repeat protein